MMPDTASSLRRIFRVVLPLLAAAITGCARSTENSQPLVVRGETGMVQVVRGDLPGLAVSAASVEKTMLAVLKSLDENEPNSEIAKINRIGDSVRLPVSRSVFRAIDLARHYHDLTGGAFDLTTGQLAALWESGVPNEDVRRDALEHSGMQHMELADSGSIALTRPGILLDPGRFAFAYALDVAMVDRRKNLTSPCLVRWTDLARRDGVFPPDEPPLVPIAAPGLRNQPSLGSVDLSRHASLALVHSSPYPPATPVVIDPRTGMPASRNRIAVVIGPITTKAYALARALFIIDHEQAPDLLAAFPGYEAMVIPDRKSVTMWMTRGFESAFTPDPFYRGKARVW